MTFVRSILFNIVFYIWTFGLLTVGLPTLLLPKKCTLIVPIIWSKGCQFLLYVICGIRVKYEGLDNLPQQNGYIIASKHQSAMETALFHHLVPNTIYIMKRSLLCLPLAGWYFIKTGCIAINRKAGMRAMHQLMTEATARLKAGLNVVIFPEGTRTKPKTRGKYNAGVAMIYEKCQVPVVPVALNTGYFWPKNSYKRYAGTVTIRFLPPIPAGLDKRAFMARLENDIEQACATLLP